MFALNTGRARLAEGDIDAAVARDFPDVPQFVIYRATEIATEQLRAKAAHKFSEADGLDVVGLAKQLYEALSRDDPDTEAMNRRISRFAMERGLDVADAVLGAMAQLYGDKDGTIRFGGSRA